MNRTIFPVLLNRNSDIAGGGRAGTGHDGDVNSTDGVSPAQIVNCISTVSPQVVASSKSCLVSSFAESATSLPLANETESWISRSRKNRAFCRCHWPLSNDSRPKWRSNTEPLQYPDSTKNKRSREKATDVGFLALNV